MSLFKNILKTKKAAEERPEEGEKTRRSVSGEKETAYSVKKPWISEKATMLGEKNVYVFDVRPNANKPTIKKEVESRYGVGVRSVQMVRHSGKMKRFRNTKKRRLGFKKAIVTVKKGDKIDMI